MKLPQEILDKVFLYCRKEDLDEWYIFINELRPDIYYMNYGSIELASWYGSICAVKYLIKKSSKSSKEMALIIGSMMGNLDIVKFLIREGVEPSEECITLCEHDNVIQYLKRYFEIL